MHSLRFIATAVVLVAASAAHAAADDANDGWVDLFNGKSLDGWTPKFVGHPLGKNLNDTFRVEDGLLKVDYSKWDRFDGRFGHLFYKKSFSRYRLRVVYRFVGEQVPGGPDWAYRNSGIMVHCRPPEEMGRDQDFPVSIEAQLLGGPPEGERPTANVCTPGTHIEMDGELVTRHCVRSDSKTYRGNQWVTVELEVRAGEVIRHFVNGRRVLEYRRPQLDSGKVIDAGAISLQAESHPVHFRRVQILVRSDGK